MLESGARPVVMQVLHQILLTITTHPVPQDVVMHPAGNIDGVYLNEAQMRERLRNFAERTLKPCSAQHEAPGLCECKGEWTHCEGVVLVFSRAASF